MSSAATQQPPPPQENAARAVSSPRQDVGSSSRGRKRSHPSDTMDDGAPPNVKLPTAVSSHSLTYTLYPTNIYKHLSSAFSVLVHTGRLNGNS